MAEVLLIFHLLGLMLGAAGSFGGTVVLALTRPAQKQKGGAVRGLGPIFARLSTVGLVILWPSGIVLMATRPGAAETDGTMSLMKIGFAVLLTIAIVGTEIVYDRARRGDPHIARLLPSLAPLSALAVALTVIFSVLAYR